MYIEVPCTKAPRVCSEQSDFHLHYCCHHKPDGLLPSRVEPERMPAAVVDGNGNAGGQLRPGVEATSGRLRRPATLPEDAQLLAYLPGFLVRIDPTITTLLSMIPDRWVPRVLGELMPATLSGELDEKPSEGARGMSTLSFCTLGCTRYARGVDGEMTGGVRGDSSVESLLSERSAHSTAQCHTWLLAAYQQGFEPRNAY